MTDALKLAEQQLLEPGGLSHTDLEKVLHHLMGPSVDEGDLYFQNTSHEAWSLEDGLVRSGHRRSFMSMMLLNTPTLQSFLQRTHQ